MLILARKVGQEIVAELPGQSIHVKVLTIQGSTVRLGIRASPSIPVHRLEVHERREAIAAAIVAGRVPIAAGRTNGEPG